MRYAWIVLFILCHEVSGFLIHNIHHSLCLEDQDGVVGLRPCNLDSRLQQWVWWNRRVLKNLGSDRCLAGRDTGRVRTAGCLALEEEGGGGGGEGGAAEEILWDCEAGQLISVRSSLQLFMDNSLSPALTPKSKQSGKWRSLDEGDICKESLRSKRASKEPEEFVDVGMDPGAGMAGMTEEQRKFLMWYYRTEDPTTWKFVMLGLSFFCLLVGLLLLGMGSMANKNRRKIAKYKAAAAASLRRPEGEELLTLKEFQGHSPALSAKGGVCPSPGEIVVTWRDGNVSTLYPDPLLEEQRDEQEKKEEYLEHFPDTEESMRDECVVNGELGVCNQEGLNGKTE
ncbi:hypothetical protein NHX12_005350 [Muraenolepis orangiensis]|uniref:Ricin B lectin domain-containing protein n=1 Tax=Muraenolepis orangiensis TaxID=630683 RepID=A0A9Q0DUV4_9TELE|nr:hypothetical protein NHX12_005350 [Muraenolepis orangiensis]